MEYEIGNCTEDELPPLLTLVNSVFRAGRSGDMGREYPLLFHPEIAAHLLVARSKGDGAIVSHVGLCVRDASILGCRIRVGSIGAVGTNPEHRGHGLATLLMADARERAIAAGANLLLISGGRGLYLRLGYRRVGRFTSYRVPAAEPDPTLEVREFCSADLPVLARLYQTEPVRFLRSQNDWEKLLAAEVLMNQPADLYVICREGSPVAYAGVQRPRTVEGQSAPLLAVRETAGSRSALAASLPGLAAAYGAPAAEVIAGAWDVEWQELAAQHGWPTGSASLPGTAGILDPERFLTEIEPLLRERTGDRVKFTPDGEGARAGCDGASLQLAGMAELTELIFGAAPGVPGATGSDAELPASLSAALDAALPLPLPWYGYNYV